MLCFIYFRKKDPRKTSLHKNRRWLASIDRQSIMSMDRHLTVLVDTHIKGMYTVFPCYIEYLLFNYSTNLRLYNIGDSVV